MDGRAVILIQLLIGTLWLFLGEWCLIQRIKRVGETHFAAQELRRFGQWPFALATMILLPLVPLLMLERLIKGKGL